MKFLKFGMHYLPLNVPFDFNITFTPREHDDKFRIFINCDATCPGVGKKSYDTSLTIGTDGTYPSKTLQMKLRENFDEQIEEFINDQSNYGTLEMTGCLVAAVSETFGVQKNGKNSYGTQKPVQPGSVIPINEGS